MSVVVIGGGLAGAASACALAQAGQAVMLFERDVRPAHKICGEFISHEAQSYLARLGVDLPALGACPIETVRLVRGARVAETRLPFRGMSLTRRTLDETLLSGAARLGVDVRRGQAVREIADEQAMPDTRQALFLATGKHELRGARREPDFAPEELVGFKMYFDLVPAQRRALAGAVEVVMYSDSYAGLQMVEGDRANLCLLADRRRLAAAGGTWDGLLANLVAGSAHLATRLSGALPLLDRPLAIARVPYGFVHRPGPGDPAGMFRLGDQVAVIPSFSGDGMSIALHSAQAAAAAYLAGRTSDEYHRQMRRELRGQMLVAQSLYRCGRTRLGQAAIMAAARLWPAGLSVLASLTRVPDSALHGLESV